MKKLLSLLSVLTISGTAVPTTIAANPYQKAEELNNDINYSQRNNLKTLNRNKRNNIDLRNNIETTGNILEKVSLYFEKAAPLLDGWIGGGMNESKNKLKDISKKLIKLSKETEININELKENIIKVSEIIKGHGYGLERKWTSIWGSNIVVGLGTFVSKLGDIIYDIQNEVNLFKNKLHNANNKISDLEKEKQQLKNDLDSSKEEINKIKNENTELEKDKEELVRKILNCKDNKEEINEIKDEKKQLEKDKDKLNQDLQTKQSQIQQLKNDLDSSKEEINKIKNENTELEKDKDKLKQNLKNKEIQIDQLKEAENELKKLKKYKIIYDSIIKLIEEKEIQEKNIQN